jgi:ribonucleotide reductase alpha subunit
VFRVVSPRFYFQDDLKSELKESRLYEHIAETAASMAVQHPDYASLAGRVGVSYLHKSTSESFFRTFCNLHAEGLVSDDAYRFVKNHADILEDAIITSNDFLFDYFGFQTLKDQGYLFRVNGKVVERPQYMWMRVAVGIQCNDIALPTSTSENEGAESESLKQVIQTYTLLSNKYLIFTSPTLFNAARENPQFASCFLLTMENDSPDSVFKSLKDCVKISLTAGGIGIAVHNARAQSKHSSGIGERVTYVYTSTPVCIVSDAHTN